MNQKNERQRYLLGEEGMKKLKEAHIAVYGLGGSGSPIVLQLAYLGVGKLSLIDPDIVEESNLNRQIIYSIDDIGVYKINAAKNRVNKIDKDCIVTIDKFHDKIQLLEIIDNYTIVVDATDDYRFKVLLDRTCRKKDIPMIHTSAVGMRGTVVTFNDNTSSYEKHFSLPSHGRKLEDVSDHEFENRRLDLIPLLVGDLYNKDVLEKVMKNDISWQTLVPAPTIAGGVAVMEIVRIILGLKPMFPPSNPFNFNYSYK
ncbi:MAG: ThiF family adenylyltransferase [Bacteroidales bacterium]|jgi:molybdopterin/thiamine biosynthesis adenylyltransferase|nr:ThiF family adenylyltransferase [Bacteroidales bacterium]